MTTLPANYVDVEQSSPEWFQMRQGMCTGSMVKNAIAKMARQNKTGPTLYQKCREDYMIDIVTTRITGHMSDRYVSKAMEEGIEREPDALMAYEEVTGSMVVPGGFVFHPEIEWFGTSPDGLVDSDIVIEAKCPTQATHFRYLNEHREATKNGLQYVPEEYLPQVKAHLSCSRRQACMFISFNPDFPKHMRLLVSPWEHDNGAISEQDAEIAKFLSEAAELEEQWRE